MDPPEASPKNDIIAAWPARAPGHARLAAAFPPDPRGAALLAEGEAARAPGADLGLRSPEAFALRARSPPTLFYCCPYPCPYCTLALRPRPVPSPRACEKSKEDEYGRAKGRGNSRGGLRSIAKRRSRLQSDRPSLCNEADSPRAALLPRTDPAR